MMTFPILWESHNPFMFQMFQMFQTTKQYKNGEIGDMVDPHQMRIPKIVRHHLDPKKKPGLDLPRYRSWRIFGFMISREWHLGRYMLCYLGPSKTFHLWFMAGMKPIIIDSIDDRRIL